MSTAAEFTALESTLSRAKTEIAERGRRLIRSLPAVEALGADPVPDETDHQRAARLRVQFDAVIGKIGAEAHGLNVEVGDAQKLLREHLDEINRCSPKAER